MKLINYLLIALVFISSCKEESVETPNLPNNYGEGLYISTSNGVSFHKDGVTKNKIFKEVNGVTLNNVNKIKFYGTKAYIAAENNLFSANVNTFENKGEVSGFNNVVDFDFVAMSRIFAVDKGDAKVKVIDMDRMEITSDVEVGDSTLPVFIVSKWYRAIVLNGGAVADSLKDSTIVAVDYRDQLVPLADFSGSLYIGDNPNSAVNINDLKILCKGIYDTTDVIAIKTEATLVTVDPWLMKVDANQVLSGVYNAQNLISNEDDDIYYFTSETGVYSMSNTGAGVTPVVSVVSDVLCYQDERYSVYNPADSTTSYYNRDILYINDAENSKNTIYKYNLDSSSFMDTIIVDGAVNDIIFY